MGRRVVLYIKSCFVSAVFSLDLGRVVVLRVRHFSRACVSQVQSFVKVESQVENLFVLRRLVLFLVTQLTQIRYYVNQYEIEGML